MDIKELGGEFKLIELITAQFRNHHDVPVTIGDDCAVSRNSDGSSTVWTTDVLVEGDHFNCDWSTPQQIGRKTLEVNVSDVAAMGARPQFLLLNLVLPRSTKIEWVHGVYDGIREGCDEYGITLLGGDTTRGAAKMVGAMVTGTCKRPVLRSGAQVGDVIAVTGDVGGSAAGYLMFRGGNRPEGHVLGRHLEPRCRLDVAHLVARYATALIDVSDGVASEVRHIAARSGVGAVVFEGLLPIHPETVVAATTAGTTGAQCALSGGEDYELLFACNPASVAPLREAGVDFARIGEILTSAGSLLLSTESGKEIPLPFGYDHFG
jgi:thiamine-monophosphate kinase